MATAADELRVWLTMGDTMTDEAAFSSAKESLRAVLGEHLESVQRRARLNELGWGAYAHVRDSLETVREQILDAYPPADVDSRDRLIENKVSYRPAMQEPPVFDNFWGIELVGDGIALHFGYGIAVTNDGGLRVSAFAYLGNDRTLGGVDLWSPPPRLVPAGTIAAQALLQELIAEIQALTATWLKEFAGAVRRKKAGEAVW